MKRSAARQTRRATGLERTGRESREAAYVGLITQAAPNSMPSWSIRISSGGSTRSPALTALPTRLTSSSWSEPAKVVRRVKQDGEAAPQLALEAHEIAIVPPAPHQLRRLTGRVTRGDSSVDTA